MLANDLYANAGKRIKQLRLMKHYTREELARKAGISVKFLNNIENGKQGFSAETLYRVSSTLHVKCDYVMTGQAADTCHKEVIETLELFDDSQKESVLNLLKNVYEISSNKEDEQKKNEDG